MFNSNGSVLKDKKTKEEYIAIFGDKRDEIHDFLLREGIGTESNIKVYGK